MYVTLGVNERRGVEGERVFVFGGLCFWEQIKQILNIL